MKKLLLIAMILGLLAVSSVARGTRHGHSRPSHDGGNEHSHSGSGSGSDSDDSGSGSNSGSDPTSGSDSNSNSNSGSDSTSGSGSDGSSSDSGSGSASGSTSGSDTTSGSGSTSGSSSSSGSLMSDSLAAHNNERNAHGVPSLTWSATLAQSAQAYADTMAKTGTTGHSSGRVNVGENLAWASGKSVTTAKLAGMWIDEKQDFIAGKNFPDCSTTGSWHDVAHYTQLMWKKTTELGCGMTQASSGRYYYVCHYSPQGNINGNPVY